MSKFLKYQKMYICFHPARIVVITGKDQLGRLSAPALHQEEFTCESTVAKDEAVWKRARDDLFGRGKSQKNKKKKTPKSLGNNESSGNQVVVADVDDQNVEVPTDSVPHVPVMKSVVKTGYENIGYEADRSPERDTLSDDSDASSEAESVHREAERVENVDLPDAEISPETPSSEIVEKAPNAEVISVDHLLGTLLTCGSHRLSSTMYRVIRKLLVPKKCRVCGALGSGPQLPCMTTIKKKGKPKVKAWYAKHDVVQLTVDNRRTGAKTGVDRFQSDKTAPVLVVKPSEWAKRDFHTPSVRNAIWGGFEQKGSRMFASIEASPIVRNRDIHMSEIRMSGKNGLERSVKKGSQVEIRLVRDENVDRMLRNVTFADVSYNKVDKTRTAVISALVTHTEYISKDKIAHKTSDGKMLESHKGGSEKAGDVVIYIECNGANCRLVNRHNVDDEEPSVFLSICTGNSQSCKIRNIPVDSCICTDENVAEDPPSPNQGILNDGTKFFVYRFLLYTDGFNAHRSRTGSMDGMYIIPLGIPIEQRTEAGCLHKICLAPPGVSATDIIDLLIDDIVNGMENGIDVILDGERCKVFLDLVCYIGDSPALASATGCKGHNSDTPCHVCTFHRNKQRTVEVVDSAGVTSSNCAERRTYRRVMDIALQENGRKQVDKLGVSNLEAPLIRLTKAIRELKSVPTSSNGHEVVPRSFDVFRCSLISPDHVFLGLIGNLMKAILRLLTPKEREEFDLQCVDVLRSNDLYGRKSVLNADLNMIKSTISEAFAILFVCPVVFRRMRIGTKKEWDDIHDEKALKSLVNLVGQLKKIVVSAQSNPDPSVDPAAVLDGYNDSQGRTRLEKLVTDSRRYGAMIEKLAEGSKISAILLDKPNVHRFFELFVHTLPLFGSIKFIEELILEKAHQSAKKAVDMSNMKNEQLQAMNDYLHDDLVCRLKSITKETGLTEKSSTKNLESDIKNLLGISSECTNPASNIVSEDIVTTIRTVGKDVCHRNESWHWTIEKSKKTSLKGREQELFDVEKEMKEFLEDASIRLQWSGKVVCELGSAAVFRRPKGEFAEFQRRTKVVAHDFVEVYTNSIDENKRITVCRSEVTGERLFIRVIGFLSTIQDGSNVEYCVGYPMKEMKSMKKKPLEKNNLMKTVGRPDEYEVVYVDVKHKTKDKKNGIDCGDRGKSGDDTRNADEKQSSPGSSENETKRTDKDDDDDSDEDDIVYRPNKHTIVAIEFSPSVRKAFGAHACWVENTCGSINRTVQHSCADDDCDKFVLFGRCDGFPPRRG